MFSLSPAFYQYWFFADSIFIQTFLNEEIGVSDESIRELSARQRLVHISGSFPPPSPTALGNHLSGNSSKPAIEHLPGMPQHLLPAQP